MDAAGLRGAPNSRSARSAVLSTAAAVAAVFGLVGATEGLRDGPMLVSTVAPRQWLLLGADAAPVPARRLRDEEEEAAASPTTESPVTTQALETVAADPVTLATTEALSTQAQEPWVDVSKGGHGWPTDMFAVPGLQAIRNFRPHADYE